METVSIVTPVTYQMHSQVPGFFRRHGDDCAVQLRRNLCDEVASKTPTRLPYRKTVSLVVAVACSANRTVNVLFYGV